MDVMGCLWVIERGCKGGGRLEEGELKEVGSELVDCQNDRVQVARLQDDSCDSEERKILDRKRDEGGDGGGSVDIGVGEVEVKKGGESSK